VSKEASVPRCTHIEAGCRSVSDVALYFSTNAVGTKNMDELAMLSKIDPHRDVYYERIFCLHHLRRLMTLFKEVSTLLHSFSTWMPSDLAKCTSSLACVQRAHVLLQSEAKHVAI